MIEVTVAAAVSHGAVLVVGAVIGAIAMGVVATNRLTEVNEACDHYHKDSRSWHELWRKINNTFNAYKMQARGIKVCINGKGGRRVWMSAHEAIELKLKEQNRA